MKRAGNAPAANYVWSAVAGAPSNPTCFAYNSVTDTLFVGTKANSVWRCDLATGATPVWTDLARFSPMPQNLQYLGNVVTITKLVLDGSNLIVATDRDYVWECSGADGIVTSASWARLSTGLFSPAVNDIAYDATNKLLYAAAYDYSASPSGLWVADLNEASPVWSDMPTPLAPGRGSLHHLAYDATRNVLYTSSSNFNTGIWRVELTGPATWTDISSSLIGVATSSLLVDEGNNILYVGLSVGSVQHGVYRIAHPTTTPTAVNTNMVAPVSATIGYSLNALVQDSDRNVLYCATGEQTGKAYLGTSPNASCSWSSISQMGTNVDVKALCYGGGTLFAATNGAAGVLFSHSTPPAGSPSVPMGVSLKAKITSMSPAKQYVGKYVTIKGTTFGSTRGSSYVKFGAVKATSYSSWSATKIVVKIPARSLVRERVVVVTSAGASNYAAFSTY